MPRRSCFSCVCFRCPAGPGSRHPTWAPRHACPELAVVGSKLQVLPAHCRRRNQLLQALALGGSERKVPVAAGEGRTVGGSALTSAPSLTVGSRRRGLRAAMCDESRSCAREEAQKPMLLNPTWPSTVCKRHAVLLARRLLTTALCTLMPAPAPQRRAQKARAHAPQNCQLWLDTTDNHKCCSPLVQNNVSRSGPFATRGTARSRGRSAMLCRALSHSQPLIRQMLGAPVARAKRKGQRCAAVATADNAHGSSSR